MLPLRRCKESNRSNHERRPSHCNHSISFVVAVWRAKEAESGGGYTMKNIAGSYIVWLVAAGLLGISPLGPCMTVVYAQSDVQTGNVITSPRGTFRIEREQKRNAGEGELATTFWITLAANPSQRVQLNVTPVSDPDVAFLHFSRRAMDLRNGARA